MFFFLSFLFFFFFSFFFTNTLKSSCGVKTNLYENVHRRIETRSKFRYERYITVFILEQMNTWNDRYIQRNNVRGSVQREIVCSNSRFLISSFRLNDRHSFVSSAILIILSTCDSDICTFYTYTHFFYTFRFVCFGIIYNFNLLSVILQFWNFFFKTIGQSHCF